MRREPVVRVGYGVDINSSAECLREATRDAVGNQAVTADTVGGCQSDDTHLSAGGVTTTICRDIAARRHRTDVHDESD
jgi:hypothetical protein